MTAHSPTNVPRIAVVMTSHEIFGDTGRPCGAWYSEIAIPYYVWLEAGASVTLGSIRGGPAVIDPVSREEAWQTDATRRMDADPAAQRALAATRSVESLSADDFDILYTPGGFGVMWDFPTSPALRRLVEAFVARDKIVTTVCHGAVALAGARTPAGRPLVEGRTLTSLTNAEETEVGAASIVPFLLETRLREQGADYRPGATWSDTALRDGWLVSGQNPASAASAARLALEAYRDRSRPSARAG